MITISAFKSVPPIVQGLVRDLRLRWALEEAGLPYQERLLALGDQSSDQYRSLQPFGQVPVFEEDGFVLFESGAIVLYVGERSEALLPRYKQARARAIQWMFAAINTIEGPAQQLAEIDLFPGGEEWKKLRRPEVENRLKQRLLQLAAKLGERDYLDGAFTAGDLMMTTVLRIVRHTELVKAEPRLAAYQARCEARPALQRALNAHMAAFQRAA
ncbi:MAG: glutathione S-transferase family protein [Chthoniobacterales bacterium]